MAAGIGTITVDKASAAQGPIYFDRIHFAGDGVYPTGGTPGFETSFRAKVGDQRTIIDVISGDCGDHKLEYDRANDKLKMRVISTGAEVGNGVDKSGTTCNITVISE